MEKIGLLEIRSYQQHLRRITSYWGLRSSNWGVRKGVDGKQRQWRLLGVAALIVVMWLSLQYVMKVLKSSSSARTGIKAVSAVGRQDKSQHAVLAELSIILSSSSARRGKWEWWALVNLGLLAFNTTQEGLCRLITCCRTLNLIISLLN